ncbi:hypothetical protein HDU85_001590 [Gaertneriomyces sp. JEL0708]|nr:hypothetical protein HDU85_001590 [Gaertneriomyces sp. JEL0708]
MSKHQPQETKKYGNDWAFRYQYKNDLPNLPFEPKLLKYPFSPDRHYRYKPDSISEKFEFEVCGPDIENGVPCAPLAMGFLEATFRGETGELRPQKLDPADEELLAKPRLTSATGNAVMNAKPSTDAPMFLKRSKLDMAAEAKTYGRSKAISDKMAAQTLTADEAPRKTREQIVKTIQETFEAIKKLTPDTVKHPDPNKKQLRALEIFPIFPDFRWSYPNGIVLSVFDGDPLEKGIEQTKPARDSDKSIALEHSFLKPLRVPGTGEDVMSYYKPAEETVEKLRLRKRKAEGGQDVDGLQESDNYAHVRDYQFTMKAETLRYMALRVDNTNGGAFYKRLGARLNLKRRRAAGRAENSVEYEYPTKLVVSNHQLDAQFANGDDSQEEVDAMDVDESREQKSPVGNINHNDSPSDSEEEENDHAGNSNAKGSGRLRRGLMDLEDSELVHSQNQDDKGTSSVASYASEEEI